MHGGDPDARKGEVQDHSQLHSESEDSLGKKKEEGERIGNGGKRGKTREEGKRANTTPAHLCSLRLLHHATHTRD